MTRSLSFVNSREELDGAGLQVVERASAPLLGQRHGRWFLRGPGVRRGFVSAAFAPESPRNPTAAATVDVLTKVRLDGK